MAKDGTELDPHSKLLIPWILSFTAGVIVTVGLGLLIVPPIAKMITSFLQNALSG